MNLTTNVNHSLSSLAADATRFLSDEIRRLFGPGAEGAAIGPVTWADLGVSASFVLIALLLTGLAFVFIRFKTRQAPFARSSSSWRSQLLHATAKPLYLLIWIVSFELALAPLFLRLSPGGGSQLGQIFDKALNVGIFIVLFWFFFRLTHVLEISMTAWAKTTESKLDDVAIPVLARSLRIILPVIGVIFGLPIIGLPAEYSGLVAKFSSILVVLTVAWILFQAVRFGEQAVLTRYDVSASDNLQARKIYTQVHVLSKTLYVVVGIFTVGSILMLFEEVRRFGTSILASAGIVGVIAGFAAQRTIANLFAGFQLAMTQPIRLDDVVIVEGEWGRIEEITLTYVVVHIWDDRRLVVPLSYFIEKPFQNWTRSTAALLGSVVIWTDYSVPMAELRNAAKRIVESNPLWDQRFWNLQVVDASERAMQIRVLATAADSSKAWDLRCEIREQLIEFIQKNYPQCLPFLRTDIHSARENTLLNCNR